MAYIVTPNTEIVLGEKDPVKSILQNIAIILRTAQKSVPMARQFGLPMRFQDAPLPAAAPTMLVEIKEAIEQFEPRATLLSVDYTTENNGVLTPRVEVEILES